MLTGSYEYSDAIAVNPTGAQGTDQDIASDVAEEFSFASFANTIMIAGMITMIVVGMIEVIKTLRGRA